MVFAYERYFLVRVINTLIDNSMHNELERQHMTQHKWWSVDNLKTTSETVYPENLISMLEGLVNTDQL